MFKKNDRVVRVIQVRGHKSATVETVERIRNGRAKLIDSELEYNAETGAEILPVLPGCNSELIRLEE